MGADVATQLLLAAPRSSLSPSVASASRTVASPSVTFALVVVVPRCTMNGHGYPSPHSDKDAYTNGLSIDTREENGVYRPVPQRSPLTKVPPSVPFFVPK